MNEKLIQTYVRHNDQWFFVSTINRESSVPMEPGHIYAETLAWSIENDNTRRDLVIQESDVANSIDTHIFVIEQLTKYGKINEQ